MEPFTCACAVSIRGNCIFHYVLLILDVVASCSCHPSRTPRDQIPLCPLEFMQGISASIIERPRLVPSDPIFLAPSKFFIYFLFDLTQRTLRLIVLVVPHNSLLREQVAQRLLNPSHRVRPSLCCFPVLLPNTARYYHTCEVFADVPSSLESIMTKRGTSIRERRR